ncbi:MAG: hypothetical protein ACJ8GL_03155, partial [Bacillus sp. (in: firmicutes)]
LCNYGFYSFLTNSKRKKNKRKEVERMKYQRTFFIIKDLIFEIQKPEITLKQIRVGEVKIENEEYKELRKKFDEDVFHIEKNRKDGL